MIVSTALCCLLGFIDPLGVKIAGFVPKQLPLSLQYYNPNHSGYVMSTMLILSAGLLYQSKTFLSGFFYFITCVVFTFFIFANGSFAPITFSIFCLLLMFVFCWIRYKNFPLKILIIFILMMTCCLLIEFVPHINSYRASSYNYIIEVIEVINHYLDVNIPIPKMWGASAEFLKNNDLLHAFTFVERQELFTNSQKAFVPSGNSFWENTKNILFGFGANAYSTFRPHNMFMSIALDFGYVVSICLFVIMLICFINFFKYKLTLKHFYIFFAVLNFVLCSLTGSLVVYSGIYLFMLLGLCFNCFKDSN